MGSVEQLSKAGEQLADQIDHEGGLPDAPWVEFINSTYTVEEAFKERGDIDEKKYRKDHAEPTAAGILLAGVDTSSEEVIGILDRTLFRACEKLNYTYAATIISGKPAVIREIVDPSFGHKTFDILTPAGAKKWFENVPAYSARIKNHVLIFVKTNLFDHWWKWEGRRQYSMGIVMAPNQEVSDAYNLFQGFEVTPKRGSWKLMRKLILEVICDGDRMLYNWVMDWLADAIQNPDKRHGVSLVMRGPKGIGKGRFAYWFGKLFGPHYLHVTHDRHLIGNFNAHMATALMVFADELIWGGNKQSENVLKAFITEDSQMLERKGFDALRIKNYARLLVASNDDWAVPAGSGERRWCVCDCSHKFKRDFEFFESLDEEMANGGLEAMMYELSTRRITTNQRDAPKTAALAEIAQKGFKPEEKWLYDMLSNGMFNSAGSKTQVVPSEDNPLWPASASADFFHSSFSIYRVAHQINDRMSKDVLMRKTKKLLKLGKPGKVTIDGERFRHYTLPSLKDARHNFAEATDLPLTWEED